MIKLSSKFDIYAFSFMVDFGHLSNTYLAIAIR